MAVINEAQLADGLESIYNEWSDKTNIDPAEARRAIAVEQARLFAAFTIGRETVVTGVQVGSETATGIIQ